MALYHLPDAGKLTLCNNRAVSPGKIVAALEFFAKSVSERCKVCYRTHERNEKKAKFAASKNP